jgi:hypothetical protein
MRRRLTEMAGGHSGSETLSKSDELTPDARERLHALGYIGLQALAASQASEDRPDPKDCIGRHENLSFTGSRTNALRGPSRPRVEFRNCEEIR